MSNPFQLIIPLKQHTPIIHFQHDQAGATLRATELKPKIDRFIRTYSGEIPKLEPYADTIRKYWIELPSNSNNSSSLYKISIVAQVRVREKYLIASRLDQYQEQVLRENNIKFIKDAPYFAQEKEVSALFEKEEREIWNHQRGQNETKSVAIRLYPHKVSELPKWGLIAEPNEVNQEPIFFIQAFTLDDNIRSILEIVIPYVLVCENFGTRQSKGFGSFTPFDMQEDDFERILNHYYRFVYRAGRNCNGTQAVFQNIQKEYQLLKAGRTHRRYAKSKLFLYSVDEMNIRWEKRKIKQEINANLFQQTMLAQKQYPPIYNSNGQTDWRDPEVFNYAYVRALLGLAEQFEFLTTNNRFKYIVQVKSQINIERYKSPLLYKVFNDRIYVTGSTVDAFMLGKWFDFHLKYKNVNSGRFERDPDTPGRDFERALESLQTPETFSLEEFIDFAFDDNNDEQIGNYQKLERP